jgi:hypothetical protein
VFEPILEASRIVDWRLLRCSGLFWSLPGLLLPILGLFMAIGSQLSGQFLERLLNKVISSVASSSFEER